MGVPPRAAQAFDSENSGKYEKVPCGRYLIIDQDITVTRVSEGFVGLENLITNVPRLRRCFRRLVLQ